MCTQATGSNEHIGYRAASQFTPPNHSTREFPTAIVGLLQHAHTILANIDALSLLTHRVRRCSTARSIPATAQHLGVWSWRKWNCDLSPRNSWGAEPAVSGVSFVVRAGDLVALLGPSGCGKSTTLRLIAGLETATSGSIMIAGKDVTTLAPAKRNVSMVFQSYALFPHLSVAENISLASRCVGCLRPSGRSDCGGHGRLGSWQTARPQAFAVVGRSTAKGCTRPRPCRGNAGVPNGRAAFQPRCAIAP